MTTEVSGHWNKAQAGDGEVRLSITAGIAQVLFDRPAARNAMTWAMYEQLVAICQQLAEDETVRVVSFRGAGGQAFVAGTDIAQFAAFRSGEDGLDYERRIDACVGAVASLPMPTLAIVEAWAVGGGLAIATACDFRIATPGTRFGVPIARTLGNCLSMANLAGLVAALGAQRVKRMLLLAEWLEAEEALHRGFLHQLCAADALDAQVDELCRTLAGLAAATQRASKQALHRLQQSALPDIDDLIRSCYGSAEFRQKVAAFVARRG